MKRPILGFVLAVLCASQAVSALAAVTLTQISTAFNTPVGIDYHETTNSVIVSVNYPTGSPSNLERINFDGSHTAYSALAGLTDELKIATVRSGNIGGFTTGDVFTGNGTAGQIVKVSLGGGLVNNPWVTLPGESGLLRGSLYVDRGGAFGGDLIAVTTNGGVWRIDSAGTPTFIARVPTHLEGMITVPNDVSKYGPLAGKIIAGAENQGLLYAFAADGSFTTYNLGVNIEDIDMINANENFFGVNFGSGRILGAAASDFAGMAGDILLTQEFPFGGTSGLSRLYWNGSALVADPIALSGSSVRPAQWEHVTFAPAGIREIPPVGGGAVPEPSSMLVWATLAVGATAYLARKSNRK